MQFHHQAHHIPKSQVGGGHFHKWAYEYVWPMKVGFVQMGGFLIMKYVQMGVLFNNTIKDIYKNGYISKQFL